MITRWRSIIFAIIFRNIGDVTPKSLKDPNICEQSKCTPNGTFRYHPSIIYHYQCQFDVSAWFSESSNELSTLRVNSAVLISLEFLTHCEGLLRLQSVSLVDLDENFSEERSQAFSDALSKQPLRFAFHDGVVTEICPQGGEDQWVLNFKRAILSLIQNTMTRFDMDQHSLEVFEPVGDEQHTGQNKKCFQHNQERDLQYYIDDVPNLKQCCSEAFSHQRKRHKRSDSDPQPGYSSQISVRQQSIENSEVNDRLEEFVIYFVKEFEYKLHAYHLILEGETKKAGKFSDTFSKTVGQGVGVATGGLAGFLLGFPVAGAKLGATVGKTGGEKLGSLIGSKKHLKKVIMVKDLVYLFQKDKNKFRQVLVKASFDIFQSFEMQFLRVTTDQGPKKAMQLLAKDATNRVINYYTQKNDALITEGVVLGKSKIEPVLGLPIATIKTSGFTIKYKYESSLEDWLTASLYEKVGLVIEGKIPGETSSYYEKKDGKSRTNKYGFRRLFTEEDWDTIKPKYKQIDLAYIKELQFTNYVYISDLKNLNQKVENLVKKVNLDDKDLVEDRIKKIIEDVKDNIMEEINNLKKKNYGYTDDRKILVNIEENIKKINMDEYLIKFRQYSEEAKEERQKIRKSIEVIREENKVNFDRLSQKQNVHHDENKREHKKTHILMERVEEEIKDSRYLINDIYKAVVAQKSEQSKTSIWFNVREPVKSFTGRDDKLKNLHDVLQSEGGQVVISQTTAITGLGGVGKSELARKYAYDYRKDYNNIVVWINAEKEKDLIKSFHELAQNLKIPIKQQMVRDGDQYYDRDIRFIVKDVYDYFKDAKSLFIFDNAEEYKDINKFLPSTSPDNEKPYILITSRNQDWEIGEEGSIKVIPLSDFTPEEATEFISKELDTKKVDKKDIEQLAEQLQYFPLALQQATAYIKERSAVLKTRGINTFGLTEYLKKYEEEGIKTDLLDFQSKYKSSRYIKTVFTTWKVTLENIEQDVISGKQALEILNILAYLSPDKVYIDFIFSKLIKDEEKLWDAIELLKQYSMINVEEGVSSIHRLVQTVIRIELAKQNKEEDVLGSALKLIKDSKDATHIISVWRYASKYSKLIRTFFSVYGDNKSTPLHLLADSNNNQAIEAILKHTKSLNIDCKDIYGRTPLYRAAENGHIKVVKLLVKSFANININSASAPSWGATEWTVLHIAAYVGSKDIVEFLIQNGATNNVEDSMNRTPLYIAITQGHEEVANLLDNDGESKLSIFASLGKVERVNNILKYKSEHEKKRLTNPTQRGKCGPLHLAANNGHLDVVKLLVENGADIDSSANDGFTPLHMAASEGYQDIVKFLVEEAKKKDDKFDILKINDISGWTVLHSAAKSGHTKILDGLITEFSKGKQESFSKALINAADTKGTTLLQTAAFHGKLNTVKFLIGKKANINAVDIFGATPLFAAASFNNYEVVKFLLEQAETKIYCDLEKVLGMLDITPLHAAVIYDNLDIAELLVKKGSRVNAGEKASLTPLHIAAFFDSSKVIKYLVDNRASTNTGINFFNIVNVLNFIKEDLKGGYGLKFIDYVTRPIQFFLKIPFLNAYVSSKFTPMVISTALNYNNQLVQRNVNGQPIHSILSRAISSLFLLPSVEKQFKIMKDYVVNKKSGGPAPPVGQDSIFYDITNTKLVTQYNKEDKKVVSISSEECPPSTNLESSSRQKREAKVGECELSWDDIEKFREEEEDVRDFSNLRINSERFINFIKNTQMSEAKLQQLVQLAENFEVTGKFQSLVNKLIGNKKVIDHLNKVGRVSSMVMQGMMVKNILVDFLNGNYQGVAINVGFIAGGQGFAKVAEIASANELKLASEGKLLLSRYLRTASPFLARGTSAFVIYDLTNQVKAFKNGTDEALAGIVGDSIYLGVDAAEIGVEIGEAFEVLEGVSSVTGPIGAAIGAVVFIGTDIYMTVKRVEKIDQIIHLKRNERFIEGLRAFIGMQPEKHIKELLEEKQLNNHLVKIGLEYLEQHSDIQKYVFPTGKSVVGSCQIMPHTVRICISGGFNGCVRSRTVTRYTEKCITKFEEDLDNTVLLDRKITDVKWSRAKPDNPKGGELFCLPQGNYRFASSNESYFCKSAIGIASNKTESYTLINLGEGVDYVKGFVDSPNIFVVSNGSKNYHGGNKDDIFILQGSTITGYFQGVNGVNTLDLTSFAPEEDYIDVKLHIGEVKDYNQYNSFRISEINRFLGRKTKADHVFITCDSSTNDVVFVDGQGGSKRFVDHIKIDDDDCAYDMQVVVRPNTVIYNRALKGNFHYIVPYALGSSNIDFLYSKEGLNLNNSFTFEYKPTEIMNIDVKNVNILNKTLHIITFNFSPMLNKEFNITISGATNPSYKFGNNTEIKVGNKGNLYMLETTNECVDDIIKSYLAVANRINKMSFFIQSLLCNETLSIGSGNDEILPNNPLHKSHLVGNGGENVYVIDSGDKKLKVAIPEVVIYNFDVESSMDTIDLRKLVKRARSTFSNSFELQVFRSVNDLLLKATVSEVKPTENLSVNKILKREIFTVRLKDGVIWCNKTHVIVDNVPMKINLENNEWSLKPLPLKFEKDKEVIIVTSEDIYENTELIISKNAENYSFVRKNGSDLMLTNVFDTNVAKDDMCTIVFSKFFETPKMKTLSIKFIDKEIILKNHQDQISSARDVNIMKKEFNEQVYNYVFNHTKISPKFIDQPVTH